MIGLGTWQCGVDSMFFKGEVTFNIVDNNGEYGLDIEMSDKDIPKFEVGKIVEADNTLTVTCQNSMLPGKDMTAFLEFNGDTFEGYTKIPFVGKVKYKDGKKIA